MHFATRGGKFKATRRLRPRRHTEARSERPVVLPPVVPRELDARAASGVRPECVSLEQGTGAVQLRIDTVLRCARGHGSGENDCGRCRNRARNEP